MKKYIVFVLVLCCVATAWAKSVSLDVAFSFDQDFEAELSMFSLYYLDQTAPTGRIHVSDVSDVSVRSFDTPLFDLPPGKTSEFILVAVYKDGTEEASDLYEWKFTGKPSISNIRKR